MCFIVYVDDSFFFLLSFFLRILGSYLWPSVKKTQIQRWIMMR